MSWNGKAFHLQSLAAIANIIADQRPSALKPLAILVLSIQVAACLVVVTTGLMLHGDGSYFVYALSVGEPWALKWADIPARSAVYVLTVVPTLWLSQAWSLSPLEIASLNALFFYAIPILQYAVAIGLMWHDHSKLLMFPVLQYSTATIFGAGFPSEILLAPGFLWICAALIVRGYGSSPWFGLSLAGALLSHELAVPAAAVISWVALKNAQSGTGRSTHFFLTLFYISAAFTTFLAIRVIGGGPGSDSNVLYVFDPRRVLNNPTFFLSVAASVVGVAYVLRAPASARRISFYAGLFLVGFFLPIILSVLDLNIDFEQGRYDSARTIIGVSMFLLSLAFAATLGYEPSRSMARRGRFEAALLTFLVLMLAVASGSTVQFAHSWSIALSGFSKIVRNGVPDIPAPTFVKYQEARKLMSHREAVLNDQMDFGWVFPYKSIVLADGAIPRAIIYDEVDMRSFCSTATSVEIAASTIPASLHHRLVDFSCTYVAPPTQPTLKERLWRKLFDYSKLE